jgi:hypothetical protein
MLTPAEPPVFFAGGPARPIVAPAILDRTNDRGFSPMTMAGS